MKDFKSGILRRLALGLDFKASCEDIGISRQTGYRMRKADPGFDAQVKSLQASGKPIAESRAAVHEQQKREAEADLRGKQNQDPRQQEPAELQRSPIPGKVIEYAQKEIQYESRVRLSSDPDFKPGMQPEWRMRELDMMLRREQERKRRESYHPLDGLRRT